MSKKFVWSLSTWDNVIIFNESNTNFRLLEEEKFNFPILNWEEEPENETTESSEDTSNIPIIWSSIEFQMDYDLNSDEWFFVEFNDEDREKMIDRYRWVISDSVDMNSINAADYNLLDSMFLIEEKAIDWSDETNINIIFNRVFWRFSISTRTFLEFENNPTIKKQNSVVDFNGHVDAYWDDSSNKLYFTNYKIIKGIFPWIEKFYRTATQEEVDDFLWNDFFEVEETFKKDKLWERLQKNIADIIDNSGIDFSNTTVRTQYNTYASEFLWDWVEFNEDWKFKIWKNKDLTNVVKVLRGCYYLDYLDPSKKMETNNPKKANLPTSEDES